MDDKLASLKIVMSAKLEPWFKDNARTMPWRETTDPYAIWISEMMLQQTQVATVIPYFDRFMTAYPTVDKLAAAPLDSVLKIWEGLGYYSRCRNLHKAAKVIMDQYGGVYPTEFNDVLALPGVGRYSAGAICSFAYHQKVPLLDGNVKRILARLLNDDQLINLPSVEKQHWVWITELLDASDDPYTFNQAIMELGATVCTPKNVKCLLCPLNGDCQAFQAGTVEDLPNKEKAKAVPHKDIGVALIQNKQGLYFIQQRPETGLLANLWEFPGGKQEEGETIEVTITREIKEEIGYTVKVIRHALDVNHAYSHFKVTLHVYHCLMKASELDKSPELNAAQQYKWSTLEDMSSLAFPKANHAILSYLKTL